MVKVSSKSKSNEYPFFIISILPKHLIVMTINPLSGQLFHLLSICVFFSLWKRNREKKVGKKLSEIIVKVIVPIIFGEIALSCCLFPKLGIYTRERDCFKNLLVYAKGFSPLRNSNKKVFLFIAYGMFLVLLNSFILTHFC